MEIISKLYLSLSKIILDALNNLAYKDDRQVVELTIIKLYGAIPRVEVSLQELDLLNIQDNIDEIDEENEMEQLSII